MRKIEISKRGQFGLETVSPVLRTILGIGILMLVVLVIMDTIDSSSVLTTGSYADNASTSIIRNTSSGVNEFVDNFPTIFTVLALVVLILLFAVLIRNTNAFGGGSS